MNVADLNQKITLISLSIGLWSGYRRATREHIAQLGGSLPDCGAITEGSIKVFPNEGTKSLQTVRRAAFRKLQAHGVRALGSQNIFAVLTDDLPEIEKEMAESRDEFEVERSQLESNYEQLFEAHVAQNPLAEAIIRSLKVDGQTVVSRCRFHSDTFKISPLVREGETEEEGVEGIVRGLGRQLYEEISGEMEKLLKNEAFVRQRVGQKTLRPIKACVKKMQKLSFLDGSIAGAVALISDTLSALPTEGYIESQPFKLLEKLVEVMSETDALLNAASKVANGVPACDVLFPPTPLLVQEAATVEETEVVTVTEAKAETEAVIEVVSPPAPQVRTLPPIPGLPKAQPFVSRPLPQINPSVKLKPMDSLKSNALMF